jgi:hypothetical protein
MVAASRLQKIYLDPKRPFLVSEADFPILASKAGGFFLPPPPFSAIYSTVRVDNDMTMLTKVMFPPYEGRSSGTSSAYDRISPLSSGYLTI